MTEEQLNTMQSQIPCYEQLKDERLERKDCLQHIPLLLDFPDYVLVMADLDLGGPHPYRHCWLETASKSDAEFVVDLVHPERFFTREEYYSRMRPYEQTLHRYTPKESAVKALEHDEYAFWDMPDRENEEALAQEWANFHRERFGKSASINAKRK